MVLRTAIINKNHFHHVQFYEISLKFKRKRGDILLFQRVKKKLCKTIKKLRLVYTVNYDKPIN